MSSYGLPMLHQTADITLFCRTCYEIAPEKTIMELPGGHIILAWPFVKYIIQPTDDTSKCACPRCPSKPAVERKQECPSLRDNPPANPDICNCEDAEDKTMHEEILSCINRMERSIQELDVAKGVTSQLSTQVKLNKEIDSAQPCGVDRFLLAAMSDKSVSVSIDDNQVATPAGRPLIVVHDPDEFHCHTCKIGSYGTANCDCTKTACSCLNCVKDHVKHAADDYEDAVRRARVGITKLQAMRNAAPTGSSKANDTQASSEDCAMPGVRKAKHLKNFTKSKMDEHNHEK